MDYETYANFRNSQNLKDCDVAKKANIPQSTFSDWKKGKSSPKADKLEKIRRALGIGMVDFYGDEFSIESIDALKVNLTRQLQELQSLKEEFRNFSEESLLVAKKYDQLDESAKDMICKMLDIKRDVLDSDSLKEA